MQHLDAALELDVATEDGVADAYLARPDDQPHPGAPLIMDAYGLRPQIEAMADLPVYDEAAAERHYAALFALPDRTVAA